MNYSDIAKQWAKDSIIDRTDLNNTSYNQTKLHHKYFTMLSAERVSYKKLLDEGKKLKLEKFEYYSGTLDSDTIRERGWEQWDRKVLKSDIQMYIDGDQDFIKHNLMISMAEEKVELLESIIKTIGTFNWTIKNIIDYEKFQAGVG